MTVDEVLEFTRARNLNVSRADAAHLAQYINTGATSLPSGKVPPRVAGVLEAIRESKRQALTKAKAAKKAANAKAKAAKAKKVAEANALANAHVGTHETVLDKGALAFATLHKLAKDGDAKAMFALAELTRINRKEGAR